MPFEGGEGMDVGSEVAFVKPADDAAKCSWTTVEVYVGLDAGDQVKPAAPITVG